MNPTVKTILIWVLILVAAVTLWNIVEKQERVEPPISFTEFYHEVLDQRVAEVTITGSKVTGRCRAGSKSFRSVIPENYTDLYERLINSGTKVNVVPTERRSWLPVLTFWLLTMLVAFGLGWLSAVWSQGQRLQPPMTTA